MSNITLHWENKIDLDNRVYLVDIYKSTNPILHINLPEPLVSDFEGDTYIDNEILLNSIYYYLICYKNEFGTYISTINKKIVTTKKDLYVDNLKTFFYLNDYDKNYSFLNNYKNISSNIDAIGATRTVLKRNNEISNVYYTSGNNKSANNNENGGFQIVFENTINQSDYTLEFFGSFNNLDNISSTLLKMDPSNNKGFFIDIVNSIPKLSVIQPTRIRYIRDWINGSTSNTSNHWVEIQAFNVNGTNVALNRSGTSSTGAWDPLLTNNITASNPYFSLPGGKQWIQVDLEAIHDITSVKIFHFWTDSRTYYETKTEGSIDGINWFTIYDSYISGTYTETSNGKTFYVTSESSTGSSDFSLEYNKYHHLCVMKKNDVIYLFADGNLINSVQVSADYNMDSNTCYIGTNNIKTGSTDGYYDSIRLTKDSIYEIEGFDVPNILDNSTNPEFLITFNDNGPIDNTANNVTINRYGNAFNNIYYSFDKLSKIYFRNTNDRLTGSIDFIENDFTLEFDFNIDNSTTTNAYLLLIGNTTNDLSLYLEGTSNRILKGVFGDQSYTISTIINPNEWYNICIIRKNNIAYIYINGKLDVTLYKVKTKFNENYLNLGSSGTNGIIGYIDNFRIYDTIVYNIEGFDIDEKNNYPVISTKRDITIKNNELNFNNDGIVNIYKKSLSDNIKTIVSDSNLSETCAIENDINDIYEYSISSNLDNYGQYNTGNIIIDKFQYDTNINNIISKLTPFISNHNNLSIINSEVLSYDYDTDKSVIINHNKFKNFCKITGTNNTANNTVNGGFSIPIENIGLQDFCIEIRCLFVDDFVSLGRIFNIGTNQTNSGSLESGIWFRYFNDSFGIGLYRGTTALSFNIPVNSIVKNKIVDIAVSRQNGIFYIYIDGIIVTTISNCQDIYIIGNTLNFFTDQNRVSACQGYYTNIRYTLGNSRYNTLNYNVLDYFDILNDSLYDNVKLAIDFENSKIDSNIIYDKSKNDLIINPVGSLFTISLPTNDNYIYTNGVGLFGLHDLYIGTNDFTIEFDFAILNTTQNTWRTILNIGKFGVEGNLKIVISNSNSLMVQLYQNNRWAIVGNVDISNEELSKPNNICITRNKETIYAYVNKRMIGKFKTENIFSLKTGIRFGKYVNSYPTGGGESIHGLYKNIRISKCWRYFGQQTYEHNYKNQSYDIGEINEFNISYDGLKNIITASSIGSFSHYELYRIDKITHYKAGELVNSGEWQENLVIEDSTILENESYSYILKLICANDYILSEWKNIYTNLDYKYHFTNFNVSYNKYDAKITWESENNDPSTYKIYVSEKENPIELDKNSFYTIDNSNEYTILRPIQNRKYYIYIERIINGKVVAFNNISYNTHLYGLLFTNYSGFTTNMNYNFQPFIRQMGLFRDDWNEYNEINHNPFISYNMRSDGNYSISNPNTRIYNMNFIGLILQVMVYNTINSYANANFMLYFEDDNNNIYAHMQFGLHGSLGASIKYGTNTTNLTTAGNTDSYPAVDGHIEINETNIKYINKRTGSYVNSFTINNVNMKNITRLRISNVTNNLTYSTTSDGTWSCYSSLRVLP